MEQASHDYEQSQARTPEELVALGNSLLDDFRQADSVIARIQREVLRARRTLAPEEEMLDERADHLTRVLVELPSRDIELARYVYSALTRSDDPRDRYWAAIFVPHMLAVDKSAGLGMLGLLIGDEETEQKVQDAAWDVLTTDVASQNLITLSEAIEHIDSYHHQYSSRLLQRIKHAKERLKSGDE
ncbi:hypothetical protein [Saccharothrix texasensis]|uniref:hypothetical protein n=1 Tax=Saccharothrix texasensis TaxID=103734 RepID=UPI0011CDA3A0|nr:hypothetical protein [Saccharothrix texasensis]